MIDVDKVQLIAKSYSPQELFAALVWQRQFNQFDGQEVIIELARHLEIMYRFVCEGRYGVRILSAIAMPSSFPIGGISR